MKLILKQLNRRKVALFLLVNLLYSISGITTSLILKNAGKLSTGGTVRQILIFGAGSVALYLFVYTVMYLNNILVFAIVRDFNMTFTKKALAVYAQKKLKMTSSAFTSFLTQDLFLFWQQYLAQVLVLPTWALVMVVSIVFMLIQNIFLGLLFAIGGLSMVIPQLILSKRLKRAGKLYSDKKAVTLEKLTDYAEDIAMLKNNGAATPFGKNVLGAVKSSEQQQYKFFTSHNLVMFWTGPFRGFGEVLPFVVGLLAMHQGSAVTFPVLIALFTASQQLKGPLTQFLGALANIQSVKGLQEKVVDILNVELDDEVETAPDLSFEELRVENLALGFEAKKIMTGVNLTIKAGQKVLLSGKSGVGKSSFFKVLMGQISAYKGQVVAVDKLGTAHHLAGNISLIEQQPVIFRGTLRENLTLFQNFSDEELLAALTKVQLIEEIPDILNVELTGSNLSGGQAMRLEIARALLRQRQIILADEVTAALDKENARAIHDLLLTLPLTVIEIAHHYELENYDQALVLAEQKITHLK